MTIVYVNRETLYKMSAYTTTVFNNYCIKYLNFTLDMVVDVLFDSPTMQRYIGFMKYEYEQQPVEYEFTDEESMAYAGKSTKPFDRNSSHITEHLCVKPSTVKPTQIYTRVMVRIVGFIFGSLCEKVFHRALPYHITNMRRESRHLEDIRTVFKFCNQQYFYKFEYPRSIEKSTAVRLSKTPAAKYFIVAHRPDSYPINRGYPE